LTDLKSQECLHPSKLPRALKERSAEQGEAESTAGMLAILFESVMDHA